MTALEMIDAFFVELKLYGNSGAIQTSDIYGWLNRSQDEYIRRYFTGLNESGKGFEQSAQVRSTLRPLVINNKALTTTFTGQIVGEYYADEGVLPDDHLYLLASRSTTHETGDPNKEDEGVRPGAGIPLISVNRYADHDDVYRMLDDPFNTTSQAEPLANVAESAIFVYTDNRFIVSEIIIDYVRNPRTIAEGADCELPVNVHSEIVSIATTFFLGEVTPNEGKPLTQLT